MHSELNFFGYDRWHRNIQMCIFVVLFSFLFGYILRLCLRFYFNLLRPIKERRLTIIQIPITVRISYLQFSHAHRQFMREFFHSYVWFREICMVQENLKSEKSIFFSTWNDFETLPNRIAALLHFFLNNIEKNRKFKIVFWKPK